MRSFPWSGAFQHQAEDSAQRATCPKMTFRTEIMVICNLIIMVSNYTMLLAWSALPGRLCQKAFH